MEELFVPYDIAVKLKTFGFDEPCFGFYSSSANAGDYDFSKFWYAKVISTDEPHQTNSSIVESWQLTNENSCIAPLYSQVFKFFRNKYKVMYEVGYNNNDKFYGIYTKIGGDYSSDFTDNFETYEEAELASINKLIELANEIEKTRSLAT